MLDILLNKYTNSEKSVNLFITFVFIIFFYFMKNFLTENPVDKQMIFITTILTILWYGLTLVSV